jgi:hypothetical protein
MRCVPEIARNERSLVAPAWRGTNFYETGEVGDAGSRVFPVVAVEIEYRRKQKVLVGTDVRFVLEMVAQHLRR